MASNMKGILSAATRNQKCIFIVVRGCGRCLNAKGQSEGSHACSARFDAAFEPFIRQHQLFAPVLRTRQKKIPYCLRTPHANASALGLMWPSWVRQQIYHTSIFASRCHFLLIALIRARAHSPAVMLL